MTTRLTNNLTDQLPGLKFVIVSHIFATGPALDLEEYLKSKVKTLLFIGHPFPFRKETNSFYRIYKHGRLTSKYKAFGWKLPEVLLYLKDSFYTLWWVLNFEGRFNYYIGSDNFSAFLGLVLKKIGKVDEVILYTIDYLPQRFKNPILNSLYHFFDKMCLKKCKVVWNVSPVMAQAREQFSGLKIEECTPQILVPLGMWHQRIPKLPLEEKEKFQIVFMGHILEKQGLDIVIKALPKIVKKIPQVKLLIIGTGPDEKRLKSIANKLNVDKSIEFTGYVENHEDVEKLLSKSTVSVATYKPDPRSFTNWADPGKIKNYLSAGLPVFLTKVPPVAQELAVNRCAVISEYDEGDVAEKITKFLKNRKLLKQYSKNAVVFASKYDWNKIFYRALSKSLS